MQLTVRVRGSLGLDDDRRLTDSLQKATGLPWRGEPGRTGDHLDGGIVEIVLVAVLGKTTELAYGAVVEKVRGQLEQWRREHLDETEYTVGQAAVTDADEPDEPGEANEPGARVTPGQDPEPEG